MIEQDEQYVVQTEAWLKTQLLLIESCDLNMEFYNKQIELLKRSIEAEKAEKKEKEKLRAIIKQRLKEFIENVAKANEQ